MTIRPTRESIVNADVTNAQQKANLGNLTDFVGDLLGDDSSSKTQAINTLGTLARDMASITAIASGTGDEMTATFDPPFTELVDQMPFRIRTPGENTVSDPTIKIDDLDPVVVRMRDGKEIPKGRLIGDHTFIYNSALNAFVVLDLSSGGDGVPIGTKLDFFGSVIPPGYLGLYDAPYTISRAMYPEAVDALWCGAGYNPDADYFYRCDNPDGSGRNEEGQYLLMPIGDGYFVRGRDSSGTVHPYQYQEDAFQGHWHSAGDTQFNSDFGTGTNPSWRYTANGVNTLPNIQPPARIPISDGVNGVPRISSETRPMNMPVARYIIKAWDVATDPGTVDIQEVLTAISVIGAAKTNRSEVFGIDQAWRDVTDMRALNTPYLNESKKPILLYLEATQTVTSGSGRFHVTIDDVVFRTTPVYGSLAPFSGWIIVNPGSTYTVTVIASGYNSLKWMECR